MLFVQSVQLCLFCLTTPACYSNAGGPAFYILTLLGIASSKADASVNASHYTELLYQTERVFPMALRAGHCLMFTHGSYEDLNVSTEAHRQIMWAHWAGKSLWYAIACMVLIASSNSLKELLKSNSFFISKVK